MSAAFLASFIFVVLAEMGDKTQLLAMAFCARYRASQVLTAVFIATILNHALAVAMGRFLATVIPFHVISLVAAFSFILFGIWTIKGDKLEGEETRARPFGPVTTVAIAFFLAEMGDKTQLATVSLAVQYSNPFGVLMGTTLGMLVADSIGICAGVMLKKYVPDRAVKWGAAVIFIAFGLYGILKALLVK